MKKMGMIVIALMLVFGAMGVSYAFWTQDIYADVVVQTGYVQASFVDQVVGPTFVDLDNTAGVAWYTDIVSTYATPDDVLTITLDNAYPGMTAVMPITIKNTGSIPIGGIGGVADMGTMPTGSDAVLTADELSTGLAVGSTTSNAIITLTVPWGIENDPTFVPKSSYNFRMTITSTQFASAPVDQFDSYTGVTAGTYGPVTPTP